MSKRWLLMAGLTVLPLTLLIAYDFFPTLNDSLHIAKPVFFTMLLVILLAGFFSHRLEKNQSPKIGFWWQIFIMGYLLLLLVVFSLMGGVSQVGLSLSSPVLWMVLLISVYQAIKEYKSFLDDI